jgi:CheY-like chemotaxis protein
LKTLELPFVLMADDDEDDRMLAQDAFAASGARGTLHCVGDGVELMDCLFSSLSLPAVILLDLNMPRKDGREALKEVKSIPQLQSIPVVVLTTSQEEKDKAYTGELGAESFITKPASFGEWIRIMRSLSDIWLRKE